MGLTCGSEVGIKTCIRVVDEEYKLDVAFWKTEKVIGGPIRISKRMDGWINERMN
jgi:hypothetical protein